MKACLQNSLHINICAEIVKYTMSLPYGRATKLTCVPWVGQTWQEQHLCSPEHRLYDAQISQTIASLIYILPVPLGGPDPTYSVSVSPSSTLSPGMLPTNQWRNSLLTGFARLGASGSVEVRLGQKTPNEKLPLLCPQSDILFSACYAEVYVFSSYFFIHYLFNDTQ